MHCGLRPTVAFPSGGLSWLTWNVAMLHRIYSFTKTCQTVVTHHLASSFFAFRCTMLRHFLHATYDLRFTEPHTKPGIHGYQTMSSHFHSEFYKTAVQTMSEDSFFCWWGMNVEQLYTTRLTPWTINISIRVTPVSKYPSFEKHDCSTWALYCGSSVYSYFVVFSLNVPQSSLVTQSTQRRLTSPLGVKCFCALWCFEIDWLLLRFCSSLFEDIHMFNSGVWFDVERFFPNCLVPYKWRIITNVRTAKISFYNFNPFNHQEDL